MYKYLFLLLAILFEVLATSFLQASQQFTKVIPTIALVLGYAISFYFLSLTLKSMPVGIAYAIWSGLGIVLISLIGFFIFKQKLDFPALLGISFIIIGVLIINLFSKFSAHQ